jgi:DNA-binding transcriptional MerR regulator
LKKWMTIAELGRHSGVGVETVRYYQRLGLLAVPPMRDRAYRRYGQDALAELEFVRRCKALGFSLKDVAVLAQLRRLHRGTCAKLHDQLAALSAQLDTKRREIEAQQRAVRALLEACSGGKALAECGALAKLEKGALNASTLSKECAS